MDAARRAVFYIGAHQDDWQLFMSPQAYTDLSAPDTTIIFIYLTAGDAGEDPRWRRGRSAGALSSIQFAKQQRIEPCTPQLVDMNGHPLQCYFIANSHSYFLDLPDGNMDGAGFESTSHQSIDRLHEGSISFITALVDDSAYATQYDSWIDLVATLRAILDQESNRTMQSECLIHILDPRVSRHSDHRVTGMAVIDAIANSSCYSLAMYEEYIIPQLEPNVSGADLIIKAGLYLFYAQTAFEYSGKIEQFDEWHLSFVPRQYRTQ